eukprot:SAG11_NODE_11099_length_783_cov_1.957602_1_plen_25_part_01
MGNNFTYLYRITINTGTAHPAVGSA